MWRDCSDRIPPIGSYFFGIRGVGSYWRATFMLRWCVWWSIIWRMEYGAWRLPGRWPNGSRTNTVAKWTQRRAAPSCAPIPDLTCYIDLRLYYKSYNNVHFLGPDNIARYDAFVAYTRKDLPWVRRVLLPKLENEHGFRLFVMDRDGLAGGNANTVFARIIKDRYVHAV